MLNPFTRTFLVSWITILDSIPDLELVSYLPSFLGGLLKFLSDPNQDVHTTTKVALDRFLSEIKKIAAIKKGIAESRKSAIGSVGKRSDRSSPPAKPIKQEADTEANGDDAGSEGDHDETNGEEDDGQSGTSASSLEADNHDADLEEEYIPGQDVQVDHSKILEILLSFLSGSSGTSLPLHPGDYAKHHIAEEEVQTTTLRWIESFFDICPDDILAFVPRLLSQVLPALSHDVEQVRQSANRVNNALTAFIISLPEEPQKTTTAAPIPQASTTLPAAVTSNVKPLIDGQDRRDASAVAKAGKTGSPEIPDAQKSKPARQDTVTPPPPADSERDGEETEERPESPRQTRELDYEAAVNALTLQFLNEHEASRVAALSWLIMLHRKSPRKVGAY